VFTQATEVNVNFQTHENVLEIFIINLKYVQNSKWVVDKIGTVMCLNLFIVMVNILNQRISTSGTRIPSGCIADSLYRNK